MSNTPDVSNMIVADTLEVKDLQCLFDNKINVLRIPDYCSKALCEQIAKNFLMNNMLECYHHDFHEGDQVKYYDHGVDRLGVSFNTTYTGAKAKKEKYYQEAKNTIRQMRSLCQAELSPFDRFRLELDEIWPHPVGIANFEGEKMLAGIIRVMNRPADTDRIAAQPHVDMLPAKYINLLGQFAMNIYFNLPPYGGELELWDKPLNYKQMKKITDDYNWRSQLGKSKIIKPGQGELILFNTRCPHAITKFSEGAMISIQSFMGLTEKNNLVLWC